MRVEENHIIELTYELREDGPQGPLLERMDVNYPLKFFFGGGKMLPAFEDRLYGLEEGQRFEFVLSPREAYGPRHPGNVLDLPRSAFRETPNAVVEGNFVALTDDRGETHQGEIRSFDEETVQIDFNHAMAGKTLHFTGAILHIRPATVDELIRKHYIEEDGAHRPDFGEPW